MARDNFSKANIRILRDRVASRCSNPDCRVSTTAASETDDKAKIIGIAAHIHAASPGGPRYDKAMSPQERKSIKNGIWLCANCSGDIDKDVDKYSFVLLNKWKVQAEGYAIIEMGKKLPCKSDAIDTLTTALTGQSKKFLADAIANVHQGSAKALEQLDPRFSVITSFDGSHTSIGIHAKETVSMALHIDSTIAKDYVKQSKAFLAHGSDICIPSDGISFKGSKLFDEIFAVKGGTFSISSKKIDAVQKLWLVQDTTNVVHTFDDIAGVISLGTETFKFEGTACNGLFEFNYKKSLDKANKNTTINMRLNLEAWVNQPVTGLPYLEKLKSLFENIVHGWKVFTSLEINGQELITSKGMKIDDWEFSIDNYNLLSYIHASKIISNALRKPILYTNSVTFSGSQLDNIIQIADTFENKRRFGKDKILKNPSCELIIDENHENLKELFKKTEPRSLRITQNSGETIHLFGSPVDIPPEVITIDQITPKFLKNIDDLKEGDTVTVEWIPEKDCKLTYSFKTLHHVD